MAIPVIVMLLDKTLGMALLQFRVLIMDPLIPAPETTPAVLRILQQVPAVIQEYLT